MIAIIEARKQDVFNAVEYQAKKSLESLSQKKGEVENQEKIIESAIGRTEFLMKRNFSTEILGFNETFDKILQEQGTQENRDTKCTPRFSFTKSEKLINVLNSEGIGNVKIVLSESKAQKSGVKRRASSEAIAGNKLKAKCSWQSSWGSGTDQALRSCAIIWTRRQVCWNA